MDLSDLSPITLVAIGVVIVGVVVLLVGIGILVYYDKSIGGVCIGIGGLLVVLPLLAWVMKYRQNMIRKEEAREKLITNNVN